MTVPFDQSRLDSKMRSEGMDAILATSPHNCSYLLGGYRSHFFREFEAIGVSRQSAAMGYVVGNPHQSFYFGNPIEAAQQELEPLWVPDARNTVWTSAELGHAVAQQLRSDGLEQSTIGIELPFMQADTYLALRASLPHARLVDCTLMLEHVRAVKSEAELAQIAFASDAIVDAMVATIRDAERGVTTNAIAGRLAAEERARGLKFDYCLLAAAPNLNRTPSSRRWEHGSALSLDSGGSKDGYIGDLARMAIWGPPSRIQRGLLEEVDQVQQAARDGIRAGMLGREILSHARNVQQRCPHADMIDFVAHGMGLVSHEAPRLMSSGPVPYPADHADLPLEAGMVLSIETTLVHDSAGFIKLEDTVVVTSTGWTALGDRARDWQMLL
jgi:Xaa-Pro aminopeptidase